MDGLHDPYEVLGVPDDAGTAIIRHAYRAMMRKYHPDLNSDEHAAASARAVNEAYRLLRDPTSRARCDQDRKRLRQFPRDQYAAHFPRIVARVDPRNKLMQRDWDVRHAGLPFLAFILISAALLTAAVTSGIFDPEVISFPNTEKSRADLGQSHSIDVMIAKFVENDPASSAASSEARTDIQTKASEEQQFSDKESSLSLSDVAESSGKFAEVSLKSGMVGAEHYSMNCHWNLKLSPSLRDADRCASFDYTAAYVDTDVARSTHSARNAYFQLHNKLQQEDYRLNGVPVYAAEERITDIRNAVRSIVDADQNPTSVKHWVKSDAVKEQTKRTKI